MERFIRMIANRVLRRAIGKGMDKGVNTATRGTTREDDMTPGQRRALRASQQRNRKMARLARRIGRHF